MTAQPSSTAPATKVSQLPPFLAGAVLIAVVAATYIFGYKENPQAAITKSAIEVYSIAAVNEQALTQLKDVIPDLPADQQAAFVKAAAAFATQKDTAAKALSLLGQTPPTVEVKIGRADADKAVDASADAPAVAPAIPATGSTSILPK
jgi:hypothetical protein